MSFNSTLPLLNGISNDLRKLLKYFNGTAIDTFFTNLFGPTAIYQYILKSSRSKKTSANIAEISKRFPEEMKKGNSKRQYEKRHFTLKKANIKPTTVKTPRREEAPQEILLRDTPETIHPIKLESFNVKKIQKASVRIQGGSRPLGKDVDDCKRILTSKKIGKS